VRSTVRPVIPEQISTLPDTTSGLFLCGAMFSGPSRLVSAGESCELGSPVAVNLAAACEPSENRFEY